MWLLLRLLATASSVSTAALALSVDPSPLLEVELPRADGSGSVGDAIIAPPSCSPKLLGQNLDAAGHDLLQSAEPKTSAACAAACCANAKCGGALFEPVSAVTYHACKAGAPCCFMKTSVADHKPMAKPVKGGSDLWEIPGRNQDDEKLSFLSATLGSHMVLQRAPQQAVLWGFTAPGSTVTTAMSSDACRRRTANIDASFPSECVSQTLTTTADPKGTWRQKLPATQASKTSYTFNISSDSAMKEEITVTDVIEAHARTFLLPARYSDFVRAHAHLRRSCSETFTCVEASQIWSFRWQLSRTAQLRNRQRTIFRRSDFFLSVTGLPLRRHFAICRPRGSRGR